MARGRRGAVVSPHAIGRHGRSPGHSPAAARGRGRRVLVVDDNVDAALSLGLLMQTRGHEVRVAHTGMAALQMAETFLPEVVLLDIAMPDMDGDQVARRLSERTDRPRPLLVALTGYGRANDERGSRRAFFDHVLVKPVTMERLGAVLAREPR